MAFSELDKLLIEQIKNFRAEGWTSAEIAEELEISTTKIETLVKAAKLPPVSSRKISAERMTQLNAAAKRYNYKSFDDITERSVKINVAKDATRRALNIPKGKGGPGLKKTYQVKTGIHDLSSKAYIERDLRKTIDQSNILKAVESGKYKTADQIRKAVGLDKKVFDKKVERLFTNIYTQIGNLNKKKAPKFGVRFLPKDLTKLETIRKQLGAIEGFQSTQQRQIWDQIEKAYGQNGETPNRKAYDISRKKAADFYKVSNEINRKYPKLNLELDHPLDYKTIKGLGKKGEKFLYVTPLDRSINRGFKKVLGDQYVKAVTAGDKQLMLKIENLAQDLGTTVGKVRGTSQVAEYGTTLLKESDLGQEIVSSLRQQNVIADKVVEMTKSGDLKTRLTEIGVKTPKSYNIGKVSGSALEGVQEIINSFNGKKTKLLEKTNTAIALGCVSAAEGGRIGYALGSGTINCVNQKLTNEPVQSSIRLRGTEGIGKIRGAATNFLKLLGRGGLKAAPLAAVAALGAVAEPLVKQFRNDDYSTYLSDPEQQGSMLLAMVEQETPKVDQEILKWQMPALGAATAAGAIPGAGELYKQRRALRPQKLPGQRAFVGPMPKDVGAARAALGIKGVLGKALGASFSPLAVAATLPMSVAAQRSGGTDWTDIATDPSNWFGPAFAASGADFATKGMKSTGILAKAIRMGMSPGALRMGSRFLGLPGLALTAGMWGYDKYKNWGKDKDDEFKVRTYKDDDD